MSLSMGRGTNPLCIASQTFTAPRVTMMVCVSTSQEQIQNWPFAVAL
jgi:hypothetical protein